MPTCLKVQAADYLPSNQSKRSATERAATRYYVVEYDSAANCVLAETATDGTVAVPVLGQVHPSDSGRWVVSVNPKPNGETSKSFLVQVEYSDQYQYADNPFHKPDEITWDFTD